MGHRAIGANEVLEHRGARGARFLASLWIVCGHFAPRLEETSFTAVRHRGNAAVNFFIAPGPLSAAVHRGPVR